MRAALWAQAVFYLEWLVLQAMEEITVRWPGAARRQLLFLLAQEK